MKLNHLIQECKHCKYCTTLPMLKNV